MAAETPDRFDAAPFGSPLAEGNGLVWEDPREVHEVVVRFQGPVSASNHVRLEYWGSRWPDQHLPKDREPGGGDVGWMELGNWHVGGWRMADAQSKMDGNAVTFTFRPVNGKEFPKLTEYSAQFRYTLKLRVASDESLPKVDSIQAYTDSTLLPRQIRLCWKEKPSAQPQVSVFNGIFDSSTKDTKSQSTLRLQAVVNSDPNTFDRTLVTVRNGSRVFTFRVDDLDQGPLYLPEYGVAVFPDGDTRDYAALASEKSGHQTLYDTVAQMPEQSWKAAWAGMPAKKSRICFPLGLDGGRQKFRLDANGEMFIRCNDQYLMGRPGRDTERVGVEKPQVHFRFGLPEQPIDRRTEQDSFPICITTWNVNGVRVEQTAFATELEGTKSTEQPPAPDVFAVAMAKFVFTNESNEPRTATLPITLEGGESYNKLKLDSDGLIWNGSQVRGQVVADPTPKAKGKQLKWSCALAGHQSRVVVVKMPYLPLIEKSEQASLRKLEFEREHLQVSGYWAQKIGQSATLITPEPVLNNFYRATSGHLLINSEFDPGSERRFARVGSFNYGAYGNESCMMVVDLDRRGYHREAAQCLEAWLHYQGSVALPGDFSSEEGVLYGAGSYEAGGYNQHHGWILWMLAEHFRFTRDEAWLRHATPGILAGSDWIIRETQRTANRTDLARGLLPAGSLEDIGDWWTWLSTSCYTWRGLDGAAWALEQVKHPEAGRIRAAADQYHKNLVAAFKAASERSPVVRLRDGTAVPQIPSYVQRRGRSFGWICQTLEGSLHLLITGAIDPRSPEAAWIVKDYEDNLFLSNQYGYMLDNFTENWFGRGGMSMQACLLLDVEPYLYRDDVKHALRALFNAIAVSHFPDVHMNTEHALPEMGDWKGDHYKSSDEANACGWLRYIFVREEKNTLLLGQAVPRDWLRPGERCGMERAATYFGPASVLFTGQKDQITAEVKGPTRNAPEKIRVRFREPQERQFATVTVNGKEWTQLEGDWVTLPGDIGQATVVARYSDSGNGTKK